MAVAKVGFSEHFIGLAGDAKPTGVYAGSTFLESDTNKTFTWTGSAWVETTLSVTVNAGATTIADGADVAEGTTTDAPADVVENATARTQTSLLKGIKNYLKTLASSGGGAVSVADGSDVTQGALADAAVSTDAAGTVNAHIRGLVKLMAAKIGITIAAGDDATEGNTSDAAVDTDTTGTVSGKLRGLVKLMVNLLSRWPAALGTGGGLKVDGSGTALPVSGTFYQTTQPASDAGPSQTVTQTPFSSADCSVTPCDLTAAPGTSAKAVALDIFFSVGTACNVTILTESGSAIVGPFPMPAAMPVQITLRGYIKGATNNKKLQMTTSVTSVVGGLCNWFALSEA